MTRLFLVSFGLTASAYFLYPIIMWVVTRVYRRPVRTQEIFPRVSLIISAYNEEATIREKIENSLALDYPQELFEIVVASESTDATNAIVESFAAHGVKLFSFTTHHGKAPTLTRVVPHVSGEIVVFSDANARLDPAAIRRLVCNYADPRVGCVSGVQQYIGVEAATTQTSESLYFNGYEYRLKRLESQLQRLLGGQGAIFSLRKSLYAPLDYYYGDDFELPVQVLINGHGVVMEPTAVAYEKPLATSRMEFRRKIRIFAWSIRSSSRLACRAVTVGRIDVAAQIILHKLLRWFVPFFLIGMAVGALGMVHPWSRIVVGAQALFYAAALAGWALDRAARPIPRLLNIPYYFCLVNVAALVASGKALLSRPRAIWVTQREHDDPRIVQPIFPRRKAS